MKNQEITKRHDLSDPSLSLLNKVEEQDGEFSEGQVGDWSDVLGKLQNKINGHICVMDELFCCHGQANDWEKIYKAKRDAVQNLMKWLNSNRVVFIERIAPKSIVAEKGRKVNLLYSKLLHIVEENVVNPFYKADVSAKRVTKDQLIGDTIALGYVEIVTDTRVITDFKGLNQITDLPPMFIVNSKSYNKGLIAEHFEHGEKMEGAVIV